MDRVVRVPRRAVRRMGRTTRWAVVMGFMVGVGSKMRLK